MAAREVAVEIGRVSMSHIQLPNYVWSTNTATDVSYTTSNIIAPGVLTWDALHNTYIILTPAISPVGLPTATAPVRTATAPLEFNKYINASDLLQEFLEYLREQKVRRIDVMQLPVELFVKWLIIRACEEDQEEPNVTLQLPAPNRQPRCVGCQRFLAKTFPVPFHNDRCASLFFTRHTKTVAQQ